MSASNPTDPDRHQGGVTIGNVYGDIRDTIIAGRDVIVKVFTGDTEAQRALRNRQAMLQLVRNTWIKGVLEQSLHGAAMIELGMEERADAVERPWDMIVQMPGQPNRQLPQGTKIIDVFDEMNQSLLILGEPGSGKTTVLLDLARDAIDRAEQDPTLPIPVVFNLSSWAEKKGPVDEWAVDELNSKYNIPKKIARPWMKNDELVLLLDGLDEVKGSVRAECVKALNQFRAVHLVSMVVCSRVADYEALTARLNLRGAVLLEPLTAEQIDQYLTGVGAELLAVRSALECDPALEELAETPVMLSIMAIAYGGLPPADMAVVGSVENTRRHLFAAYVQSMFRRRTKDKRYSPRQTIRWLSWLSQKMTERAQAVFLIERMQPDWLDAPRQQRRYLAATVAVFGLVSVLAFGLNSALAFEIFGGHEGFGMGVMFGVMIGLAMTSVYLYSPGIETVDAVEWSAGGAPIFVVAFGLVFWLAVALVVRPNAWSARELPADKLGVALRVVAGFALSFGHFFALLTGIKDKPVQATMAPNQRITQSATNAASVGPIFGLVTGVVFGVLGGVLRGLLAGLSAGLFGVFVSGGYAVIQHFGLRLLLTRTGHLPWRYARFLDYATERIFLRKVGGGYIFVHRLLMEYFASLTEAEIAGLERAI